MGEQKVNYKYYFYVVIQLMIIEVMTIYFTNSKLRRLDVQYAIFWLGIIAADWVAVRQLFYLPALPCKSASMSSC